LNLAERYHSVRDRIEAAASRAGRRASDVELVVVTKNHPAQLVSELYQLGQRHFGENRDQEAKPKVLEVQDQGCLDATWHFVGQLQSNKVKSVLDYARVIHSIDRPSLVAELSKQLTRRDSSIAGFIELNLTDDSGRGGVQLGELEQLAEQVLLSGRIELMGVMAVASLGGDPRADFAKAMAASERLVKLAPSAKRASIGMSDDFELAIEMGATHIRVGSAITGPRPNYA
jgi:pyridoxal phosphate enzyme (YggS family)